MDRIDLENLLEGMETIENRKILSKLGDDAAVLKISDEMVLVQTIDAFTPLHDDPVIQGKLSACNSLNDLYAMGVHDVISVLVIMAFPEDMPKTIAKQMLRGFVDFSNAEGAPVIGGHTIKNPWPIIGGACTGVSHPSRIIYSHGARPGDVLVLTKPLGIQSCMAAYRALKEEESIQEMVFEVLPRKEAIRAVDLAVQILLTSNKKVAIALENLNVSAATDVTGFGIRGHALNIAKMSQVDIKISELPVIKGALELSELFVHGLNEGNASETAGGMLLSIPEEQLGALEQEFSRIGIPFWKIGSVVKGTGKVHLKKDLMFIEIDKYP
ncbi:MAG: selenide, water dikinase SelD [Candidatus Helarchaeota archaeon]